MSTATLLIRRTDWTPVLAAVLILLLLAGGSVLSPQFAQPGNLRNVLEQCASTGFVALGQTLVILTGGIDFSVAGLASLSAVLLAGLPGEIGLPFVPMLGLVLTMGTGIGLLNGAAVRNLRVNPLIVTLGMDSVLEGASLLYRKQPGGTAPDWFQNIAFARVGFIPETALILLVAFAVALVFLRFTRLGRAIYAIGGDAAASRLSGLPVGRTLLVAYAASGFLAALTGAYLVSRTGVGDPRGGIGLELASITPVVVGGTVLGGGRGGVVGTLIGVLLLTLLNDLLNFLGISTYVQWIVQGAIVILAVSAGTRERGA